MIRFKLAIRSCITPLSALHGVAIVAMDGFSANGLHPVQPAWIECNAPQCGYCPSGQIMQASSLLKSNPEPSDDDIANTMAGNICRCGTSQRIRAAIKSAVGPKP